jgi:GT2 family glycosyltransferase
MSSGNILFSVVIPTFKRPELLERCLTALQAQSLEHCSFEIIVADDAAEPPIQDMVNRLSARQPLPEIRYVAVSGPHGPAAARNQGWRSARGMIIAFTDDDCIPDPGWLMAARAAFSGKISAAWGRLIMPLPKDPTDYEYNASLLADATFVTANCFVSLDALERIGGFDERFPLAWREDSDLLFRLIDTGHQVMQIREAVVTHPIRPAPWGVSLQQLKKSIHDALLFKKHPDKFRKWVGQPPWNYYAIVASYLLWIFGVMKGQSFEAIFGLLIWSSLTVEFCMRRLDRTSHRMSHVMEMIVTSILIPPLAIFWRLAGALKYRVAFL